MNSLVFCKAAFTLTGSRLFVYYLKLLQERRIKCEVFFAPGHINCSGASLLTCNSILIIFANVFALYKFAILLQQLSLFTSRNILIKQSV